MTQTSQDAYGRNDLLRVALTGDLERFKILFAQNDDAIMVVDNNKDTALHLAAMKGHVSIMQFLLRHGADINGQDKFGATPLHLASITGNAHAVRYLLQPD